MENLVACCSLRGRIQLILYSLLIALVLSCFKPTLMIFFSNFFLVMSCLERFHISQKFLSVYESSPLCTFLSTRLLKTKKKFLDRALILCVPTAFLLYQKIFPGNSFRLEQVMSIFYLSQQIFFFISNILFDINIF